MFFFGCVWAPVSVDALRIIVLTYMGFFNHDLAKQTHLLTNMASWPKMPPVIRGSN